MGDYAGHMLNCAKWFHSHTPKDIRALPARFDDTAGAIASMRDALLFEAHADFQAEIPKPGKPMLNAVDLPTDSPGIVNSRGTNVTIDRGDATVVPIEYRRTVYASVDESRIIDVKPARVANSLRAANRMLAKRVERDENRASTAVQRVEDTKRRRADTKRPVDRTEGEKPAKKGAHAPPDLDDAVVDDAVADSNSGPETSCAPPKPAAKTRKPAVAPVVNELEGMSDLLANDSLRNAAKQPRGVDPTFFQSPVPHDRHLSALMACDPHPNLRDTLLTGVPAQNEHLVITEGPPGTGKTFRLIEQVRQFMSRNPTERCFLCAPTNVGAADLYTRAFESGVIGCLVLSKEHMPAGVPAARWLTMNTAKLVVSTISARSGPKLCEQRFDACFVDEAAHCPESFVWGLLRPDTYALYLAGDSAQLPATVSRDGEALAHGRSLMERLRDIGVCAERLRVQRRMHPEIVAFPNAHFYGDELTTEYTPAEDLAEYAPYEVVHVRGEETRVGTSFENANETRAIAKFLETLTVAKERVVLITPYVAQQRLLRAQKMGVRVETVDSFQGKESDVVLLSLVRTEALGFWKEERRLNVALTRARHVLRVFASGAPTLLKEGVFGDLHDNAATRDRTTSPSPSPSP